MSTSADSIFIKNYRLLHIAGATKQHVEDDSVQSASEEDEHVATTHTSARR
jgi:hypothetical protein